MSGTITAEDMLNIKRLWGPMYSGCMQDNDCSCSDAQHERDRKIIDEYIKAGKPRTRRPDHPFEALAATMPDQCSKLLCFFPESEHPQELTVLRYPDGTQVIAP